MYVWLTTGINLVILWCQRNISSLGISYWKCCWTQLEYSNIISDICTIRKHRLLALGPFQTIATIRIMIYQKSRGLMTQLTVFVSSMCHQRSFAFFQSPGYDVIILKFPTVASSSPAKIPAVLKSKKNRSIWTRAHLPFWHIISQ